ncbi:MAG: hypothetical protein R2911_40990 [Caldilineaceae bacterium]
MMRLDEAQEALLYARQSQQRADLNQGDELSRLWLQTAAVSERLKVLALDPVAVVQLAAYPAPPGCRAVLNQTAARIVEQT